MDHRISRNVLRMVGELHIRGYQRIRIFPGMNASGTCWRCTITCATNISSSNGAKILSWDRLVAKYTTAQEGRCFDWEDVANASPNRLAKLFLERFPDLAAAGRGADWVYVGWYAEMLSLTYPDSFPIFYADREMPTDYILTIGERDYVRIPLPPPGWGPPDNMAESS